MASFLSTGALTLGVSLAAHSGIAIYVLAHAPQRPSAPSFTERDPSIEVSLAPLADPDPVLEPTARTEPRTVSPPSISPARVSPITSLANTAIAAASSAPASSATTAPIESAATPFESAAPEAPRFVLQAPVISAVAAPSSVVRESNGRGASADAPFAERQVDQPAKLQAGTPPSYTAAAEAAGVEVELPLEVVVDATGAVQSAHTLEHVGYGLDEAAVAAVRRYRFSPALRAGKPVAVRMRWVLRFQLR